MAEPLAKIQQLLGELAEQGPGGSVELLLRQLEPAQAEQLRLCAIPHEFDPEVLRALAPELSGEEARQRCEQFSRLSMVRARDGSLALHEESRRHLFGQWLTDEAALRVPSGRLVEHFEKQITELERSSASAGTDPAENAARRRMFHLIGASRADGLAEFEHLCRERREQLRLSECETLIKLVHEYEQVLTPLEKSILAYHEAKLAADRHKWKVAEDLFQRVLKNENVPLQLRVKTHCRLGIINDAQRRWSEAIRWFNQGLELADSRPECSEQTVHLHLNLGSTYRDAGEMERAEELLQKGIVLAREAGETSSLADGYNSLGTLYLKLNDNRRAIEAYDNSLQYLDEYADRFRRAQVYNNLGNAYADERDWEKSEHFYRQSLEIKREAGDNYGQAMTLTNLVRIYRTRREEQRAIEACHQSILLFGEVHDDYNVAVAKQNLGGIYRSLGQTDPARRAFQEAADLFALRNEEEEAQGARKEAIALDRKFSLPWWVVMAVVLFALLAALMALGLAVGSQ